MDVPLWPREQAQAYIMERVLAHQAAQSGRACEYCGGQPEGESAFAGPCPQCGGSGLPDCTDEERWLRDTKWAVMKGGAARATKLHDTEEAATLHVAELQAKEPRVPYSVEFRPGTPTRCIHYCTVGTMGLCSQHNEWTAAQEVNDAH